MCVSFEGYTALTGIYNLASATGLWFIRDYAFYNCENLKTGVKFPSGFGYVESFNYYPIGRYSFANTGITSVDFPKQYFATGSYAFANCKNLKTVTMRSFSKTLIGSNTFYNCPALTSITVYGTYYAPSGSPWGATNAKVECIR